LILYKLNFGVITFMYSQSILVEYWRLEFHCCEKIEQTS